MTYEELEKFHSRVEEYAIAAHGDHPDRILLEEDGVWVEYDRYFMGSYDTDRHSIPLDRLDDSLDEVREKRLEAEKKRLEALRVEKEQKEQKRLKFERLKRFAEYKKLKEEFKDEDN